MKRLIFSIALCALSLSVEAQSVETLTSDAYQSKVLDYSLTLKQSSEQAESVRQAMREAKTAYFPTFDFSGSYQYQINESLLDFGEVSVPMDHHTYSMGVQAALPIYQGGAVRNQNKAAKVQHDIARQNEELTRTNVIYAARSMYWMTVAKHDLYKLVQRYVEIITDLERVITDRFDDGLIAKTDLLQMQTRLSDARVQQSEAYKAYKVSLQNLNIMMGVDPMAETVLTDNIDRTDNIPSSLADLNAVLDARQEYRIAGMNVAYQTAQMKISRSKYLPSLSVGVKEMWGTKMLNVTGATQWDGYVFASLNIPIFHWGAKYRNVASRRAIIRSEELALLDTRDRISQELSAAYTNLVENSKQIGIAMNACAIAEEGLDLNTFSYNEGRLPIIDVLSAQSSWIQANSNLIKTWLQEKISYVDYRKAMGDLN